MMIEKFLGQIFSMMIRASLSNVQCSGNHRVSVQLFLAHSRTHNLFQLFYCRMRPESLELGMNVRKTTEVQAEGTVSGGTEKTCALKSGIINKEVT